MNRRMWRWVKINITRKINVKHLLHFIRNIFVNGMFNEECVMNLISLLARGQFHYDISMLKSMSVGQNIPTCPLITHWGRVTYIGVSKLSILGSDNGLSPGRRQPIIWTSAGLLLIGPLRKNFSEIVIKIHTFSFRKMHLKMSSGKWRPFGSASMC